MLGINKRGKELYEGDMQVVNYRQVASTPQQHATGTVRNERWGCAQPAF